ncbi:O-antigen ligase family protein [Sphingorhabdus sp.]|uniref:O-antigen ligase family protein n=1 Tax=Sphingorhabdus sp. TaxID=1902408 RepID=UPI003983D551
MGSNASRITLYPTALLIGLLPVWMVLLPLDMTSKPENWQVFVRAYSFVVPLVQMIFVLVAMGSFFSPFRALRQLPRLTKAALLIWIVVVSVVSFQPDKDHVHAAINLSKLTVAALFLLALIDMARAIGPRFILALWISVGIGTLLYVLLWATHIVMVSPQGEEWVIRVPGVNNVRHTGYFAFAIVVAGLVTLISFRNSTNLYLRWGLPILFGVVGLGLALWTGSRGPLLASLVAMFATLCVAAGNRKLVATFLVSSALAATAVVSMMPVPHPIYGIAGATGMADVTAKGDADASSGRKELWAGTIDRIAQRPLMGWGVGQFGEFGTAKPDEFFHPHNFPLQFLFAGGILSVLLICLTSLPALRRWGWPYAQGPSAAGVGGVMGMMVYSLYDGALYFSYPITIFIVAIVSSIAPAPTQRGHDTSD